jgi:hypothetical protein
VGKFFAGSGFWALLEFLDVGNPVIQRVTVVVVCLLALFSVTLPAMLVGAWKHETKWLLEFNQLIPWLPGETPSALGQPE